MKPVFLIFLIVVLLTPILTNRLPAHLLSPQAVSIQPTLKKESDTQKPQMTTLIFGGDVMLGRSVNTQSIKKADFSWAFRNISREFSSADISFINLETPLTVDCPQTDTGMVFCASPGHIEGLKAAGIDIASIANNHSLNQGQQGLANTRSLLDQNGISPLDPAGVVKDVKGVKFGFLGYNALDHLDEVELAKRISSFKKQVDVLILSFHWGSEYTSSPNTSQIRLAHLSIDSGADIVIGHHPHWIQKKEIYAGKMIFYSLGNLIFDQPWSEKTREGLVVKLYFSGKTFLTTQELPVRIEGLGQPRFVNSLTLK